MIQMYLLNIQTLWMILIVFDDMIADIMTNKKISSHNQRIVY